MNEVVLGIKGEPNESAEAKEFRQGKWTLYFTMATWGFVPRFGIRNASQND